MAFPQMLCQRILGVLVGKAICSPKESQPKEIMYRSWSDSEQAHTFITGIHMPTMAPYGNHGPRKSTNPPHMVKKKTQKR